MRIHVTNDPVNGFWRVEVLALNGDILYGNNAHSLNELAKLLHTAADMVAFAALEESKSS